MQISITPARDIMPKYFHFQDSRELIKKQMSKDHLKRALSPMNVWALAFGCVIGWSAFIMPGAVFLNSAGPLGTMAAIELAAFIMLIISYSYSYMIKKFPSSGGEFVYAGKAFGRANGFICAWFLSLSYLCVIPLNATALNLIMRTLYGDFFEFGFHYNVSGYDVYFGEILIACLALITFAFICTLGARITGILQTIMVFILIGGIVIVLGGVTFINVSGNGLHLKPMFNDNSGESIISQIIAVFVTAPMSFVGFDTVPQFSEESNFSNDRVKVIMDSSILCGCIVYIALTFLACSYVPENYSNWIEYINDLKNLDGVSAIPTLGVSYSVLGKAGLFFISASVLAAMFTGICGFYMATSRLLYAMSCERIIPKWFSSINNNNVPRNAVIFCMLVSMLSCLLGRSVLGTIFDMASVGGAIGFCYTCLAARKYAIEDNERGVKNWGTLGAVFSAFFVILLLVPVPGLNVSLNFNGYLYLGGGGAVQPGEN